MDNKRLNRRDLSDLEKKFMSVHQSDPRHRGLNLKLRIWRQAGPSEPGHFMEYQAKEISSEASFLEMLDIVNNDLVRQGKEPVVFDHDCREGICGSCALTINGNPHGP